MINILIVDDHKILRDGIKAIFKDSKDIKIVGECEDGSEVSIFLQKNKIDVILMDIMMPTLNGIETTKIIKEHYPEIKILALSMHNDYNYIQEMLEVGASGYILKNTSGDEMLKAIQRIYDGKTFFTQEVTDIVMDSYLHGSANKTEKNLNMGILEELTEREIDVLKLIAEEYTNKEIGDKLFISRRTVDTHRRNLIRKIGAKNSIGLIRFAYNHGLID